MEQQDCLSVQEKPAERKLSNGFSTENRLRTKSFGEKGTTHVKREYVGDEMDRMLFDKGMVKKAIPRDNTSIFRAVCEQISSVQTDYQDLRMLVEHMLRPIARRYFEGNPEAQFDRDREIFEILADITCSRIIVYRIASAEPTVFEGPVVEETREIKVCEGQYRGVYEPVYSSETHESLAISQSVAYRILYEDVFKQPPQSIDEAIHYIRLDIDKHSHSTLEGLCMMDDHHMHAANAPCMEKAPKYPFCACKSLDPAIYRNVEYDLYRTKTKENEQAYQNSLAVKFCVGSRCLARDGGYIRNARVISVVKHDVRLVIFEDPPTVSREFDVSDLRPLPASAVAHHTMQSLIHRSGGGRVGGPQNPMPYLPGCSPLPMFNMPSQQSSASAMPMNMGVPPPSTHWFPHTFPPPPMMTHQSVREFPPSFPPPPLYSSPSPMMMPYSQQHFSYGSNDMMMGVPPPPPTPMRQDMSKEFSPAPAADSAAYTPLTATPLSSRKAEDGRRNKNKKARAISIDLTDSPIAARSKKMGQQHGTAKDGEQGRRRATEGDAVGDVNRSLQPKQQQHYMSTCSSLPEHEAAAYRSKLPSLLPLPSAQARSSYYASSEWTGDDTVFTADEGAASQMSLSNNAIHDSSLVSSQSANDTRMDTAAMNMGYKVSIPFISMDQFKDVDKLASYSENTLGDDLPDMLSTRFFYNLGVQFFRNNISNCGPIISETEIRPPPPDAVPMPPVFLAPSPSMPPNSPAFFSGNGHFAMLQTSAAPPNTPAVLVPTSMPPYLAQYYHPRVEGMPPYGYVMDDGRGNQIMEQGHQSTMLSPSPIMAVPQGNFFFPTN